MHARTHHGVSHTPTHVHTHLVWTRNKNLKSHFFFFKVPDEIIRIQCMEPLVRLERCEIVLHFELHCITPQPNYLQLKWLSEAPNCD